MNMLLDPKGAVSCPNGPRKRMKLYEAFVLTVMMSAWAGVAAQAPARLGGGETGAERMKGSPGDVKQYACPMHPNVKSTKRGKCSKCGMDLRLVRAETASDQIAENKTAESATSEPNLRPSSYSGNGSGAARKMVIPDVEVLDQYGHQLHFYSDLIKGKTVAINFIFTNCTTICPPLAATFARVQKEMGDKVGRDVTFISISVDPLTDTPERLRSWGTKFKAGAGWTFVTGDKREIEKLLTALGASVARREDHSPTVIVGNDVRGIWTRTYGLANPTQLVALILKVME